MGGGVLEIGPTFNLFSFHDESLELRILANNLQNNGKYSKKNYSSQVGQLSYEG